MLLKDILSKSIQFLKDKKFEQPRLEAEILIAEALKMKRLDLYLKHECPLTEAEIQNCRDILKRRVSGEPVAYITRSKGFYGFDFKVGSGVLIPRPETESLVEFVENYFSSQKENRKIPNKTALESAMNTRLNEGHYKEASKASFVADNVSSVVVSPEAAKNDHWKKLRFLDLGAGSGCIGLTLLKLFPAAELVAVEFSNAAISYIKQNAEALNVLDRLTLIEKKVEDVAWSAQGLFHAVVSNPPYIDNEDIEVEEAVRRFEPSEALFAEEKGLKLLKDWSLIAKDLLVKEGLIVFEMGYTQGEAMKAHFESLNCFKDIEVIKDLSEKDRFIKGVKVLS